MSRLRAFLLLVGQVACGPAPADPCLPMCAAAAALYGRCLDEAGADWAQAGFEDADDFTDSCETWAWEMRRLEADAVDRGHTAAQGALDAACADRDAAMRAVDATCAAYTGIDWSEPPWEGGASRR